MLDNRVKLNSVPTSFLVWHFHQQSAT